MVLAITLSINHHVFANDCNSDDPIVLATHNWTSQIVISNIVGLLFEKMGCKVEFKSIDVDTSYNAILTGDITLALEAHETAFPNPVKSALITGDIIDAGYHEAIYRDDWWYPTHVEDLCPGLPDWNALNRCSKIFSRSKSEEKGVYFDGPKEWQQNNNRIKSLGLNFVAVNVDSPTDLWLKLDEAVKTRQPIVLYNWSPNFTDALYGGSFVEFPDYDERCPADATWGTNPEMTDDCGSPAGGHLKKLAWNQMPTRWPGAYKALSRINFTSKQIGAMANYVDVEGMTHQEAANQWMSANTTIWSNWLNSDQ